MGVGYHGEWQFMLIVNGLVGNCCGSVVSVLIHFELVEFTWSQINFSITGMDSAAMLIT